LTKSGFLTSRFSLRENREQLANPRFHYAKSRYCLDLAPAAPRPPESLVESAACADPRG